MNSYQLSVVVFYFVDIVKYVHFKLYRDKKCKQKTSPIYCDAFEGLLQSCGVAVRLYFIGVRC